jgi:hypothetical protein
MPDITEYDALLIIQRSDPDGGETEPTDEDHARHQRWAIERFGPSIWQRYRASGWLRDADNSQWDGAR